MLVCLCYTRDWSLRFKELNLSKTTWNRLSKHKRTSGARRQNNEKKPVTCYLIKNPLPSLPALRVFTFGDGHTRTNKHHKHAETDYLWKLWNNCGSSTQLWELCIICLTFPASAFLLFYLPNGRKKSAGPIASGPPMTEHIRSLWKYFKKTLKKHHNQEGGRENSSHSHLRLCWQMCKIAPLYLGFHFTVVTGQRHGEQLGIKEGSG